MRELIQKHHEKIKLYARLVFFSLLLIISYIAFLPNYDALPELTSFSDILNHFMAFFVLAIFLDLSYSPRILNVFLSLLAYGFFIESVQYFLPNRAFDLLDLLVDMCGVGAYIVMKVIVLKRKT